VVVGLYLTDMATGLTVRWTHELASAQRDLHRGVSAAIERRVDVENRHRGNISGAHP